jgi:hypothetical protein
MRISGVSGMTAMHRSAQVRRIAPRPDAPVAPADRPGVGTEKQPQRQEAPAPRPVRKA